DRAGAVRRSRRRGARDEGPDGGGARMIFGIGVDVLESGRIARTLERFCTRFLEHLLMPEAQAQFARTERREPFGGTRFAAKDALRGQDTGGDFLSLEQHRVVAIACALRTQEGLKLWSLGETGTGEGELVQRFFDGIEKFSPDLVSWNGSSFDLPVLTYRALLRGVQAARFWESGAQDPASRYND